MLEYVVKRVFTYLGAMVSGHPFEVEYVSGERYRNSDLAPLFTLRFVSKKAYWRLLIFQGYGLAEAYLKGHLDIEGDIRELVHMQGKLDRSPKAPTLFKSPFLKRFDLNRVRNTLHELRFGNRSVVRARENAKFHYNLGTEMFRQYLDPSMTYTCAYWKAGTKTLEEAQQNKIEHTLRKLCLKPGDTLVDVGAGWGELLMQAAERYGAKGTNVSPTPDQNEAMRRELEKRGLEGKVAIKEMDFREDTEIYDKYVSLGVYEHAGYNQLEDWIAVMARSLKEGGIGVLHFIGNVERDFEKTGIFIRKYIFPGGYLPGLAETLTLMDKYDLEILDVENLRRHYALTLDAWAANFDAHWEKIHALDPEKYDDAFRRRWRFFLYSCSAVFGHESLRVGLYQVTFCKGKTKDYPLSRDFLYAEESGIL